MKTENNENKPLSKTDISRSVIYKIMSGTSELERFKNKEKAEEVCEYYNGRGFPNARVVKTYR